jgi:hypothetical protein
MVGRQQESALTPMCVHSMATIAASPFLTRTTRIPDAELC